MGLQERQERHRALLAGIRAQDTFAWCRSFLNALENGRNREPKKSYSSPSETAMKALQEIELARVWPRVGSN
jgi:trehalose 6-phosphate synthase